MLLEMRHRWRRAANVRVRALHPPAAGPPRPVDLEREGRWQGSADPPLSEGGRAQARDLRRGGRRRHRLRSSLRPRAGAADRAIVADHARPPGTRDRARGCASATSARSAGTRSTRSKRSGPACSISGGRARSRRCRAARTTSRRASSTRSSGRRRARRRVRARRHPRRRHRRDRSVDRQPYLPRRQRAGSLALSRRRRSDRAWPACSAPSPTTTRRLSRSRRGLGGPRPQARRPLRPLGVRARRRRGPWRGRHCATTAGRSDRRRCASPRPGRRRSTSRRGRAR